MNDHDGHDHGSHQGGTNGAAGPPYGEHEPVGSVTEEAAKLLSALQGWAREHVADYSRTASGLGSSYIADGSAACKVCPLCQLIAAVRGINPESIEHLGHAAGSVFSALAGLVEAAQRSDARRDSPVEKISLLDDDPEETPWH